MSDAVAARRAARRRFLEHLYRCSEEELTEYQDGYEVAALLGLERADAERIVRYLEDHGFVVKSGTGMVVRITARGIDAVETGGGGADARRDAHLDGHPGAHPEAHPGVEPEAHPGAHPGSD